MNTVNLNEAQQEDQRVDAGKHEPPLALGLHGASASEADQVTSYALECTRGRAKRALQHRQH